MIQKIKTAVLVLVSTVTMAGVPGLVVSGVASAACSDIQHNINNGVNSALTGTGDQCEVSTSAPTNSLASLAKTVVNILSLIVGILAVIMIIYGGLRYITSGGSSEGVGGAKNTIIYAIIGLVIVALAQLIVHFVLNAAFNAQNGVSAS
jgi:hypothetical protein